ncbi:outer membrane protein, 31 kDa [Fulvimarina pelagi HTCC2506]|uniref:Outer membrane protein, 31 kDa n=2 Tax=Fulvimarina pelagi TaxID=217511 RepID=Q0G1I2_9HYPH|nr:outer membrane protein [Fulvimarina pelagi]EAU41099.1 outer membrane protein, 31 kDa [Fulvimarina pelagi HTCC2506]BAT30886.1 outer membrane protein [Fulvimarina pelagi]
MRELLLGFLLTMSSLSAASAADLYDDPSASYSDTGAYDQTPSDWTGGYVGVTGGLAAGESEYSVSDGTGFETTAGGGLGGVQAGYDVQLGRAVLGGVADISLTGIDADVSTRERAGGVETTNSANTELDYLGTVRARAGYAASDRVLAYGHGGLAYGRTDTTISESERRGGVTNTQTESRKSDTKYGYAVGAGLEYKATDNVSLQTEYGYHDLGKDRLYSDSNGRVDQDLQFHAVKAGVNFRF